MAAAQCNAFNQLENLVKQTYLAPLTLNPDHDPTFSLKEFSSRVKTSPGYSFFHTIKHIRGNSLTVCKCNICAGVYIHMWQYVQCVWVCQKGSVLLSPSTVLTKASGGRQKGWTEWEGGGGKDMHVWLPDLCDGERERGREGWIGNSGDTTHQAPDIIASSWLCCNSYSSECNAKYDIFIHQKYAAFFRKT